MPQARQQQQPKEIKDSAIEGRREGARWINVRPTSEEFAGWYKDNVPVAEGLDPEKYLGGIVLIPAEEKVKKVMGTDGQGEPVIRQVEQLVFIPYPKVEARVNYFWDLMELHAEDWRGVVEPLDVDPDTAGDGAIARMNRSLPDGFFVTAIPVGDGFSYFINASYRVAIYDKEAGYEWIEHPLRDGRTVQRRVFDQPPIKEARGTKMVALQRTAYQRTWADENSVMKAETGAIGRALGLLGMLAVPGSGVATAEDMLETLNSQPADPQPAPSDQAKLPDQAPRTGSEQVEDEHKSLIDAAKRHVSTLGEDYPGKLEEFREWAKHRNPPVRNIGDLKGPALKGVVKKLEKLVQEGEANAQQAPTTEATDEPSAGDPGSGAAGGEGSEGAS